MSLCNYGGLLWPQSYSFIMVDWQWNHSGQNAMNLSKTSAIITCWDTASTGSRWFLTFWSCRIQLLGFNAPSHSRHRGKPYLGFEIIWFWAFLEYFLVSLGIIRGTLGDKCQDILFTKLFSFSAQTPWLVNALWKDSGLHNSTNGIKQSPLEQLCCIAF